MGLLLLAVPVAAAAFLSPHKLPRRSFSGGATDPNLTRWASRVDDPCAARAARVPRRADGSAADGEKKKRRRRRRPRSPSSSSEGDREGEGHGEEAAWLARIDARLASAPVGELSHDALRQLHPAASAWARRGTKEGAERAHGIMKRAVEEMDAGNELARPMTKLCNAALSAWAKIGSCEEATRLLIWMNERARDAGGGGSGGGRGRHDVRPDTISYATVIDSWAKSGREEAPHKAERLLRLMDRADAGAGPNTIAYNGAINAWARSAEMDKAVRAEALVGRMKALHRAGNLDVKPDVFTYQSLISAWSTSKVWGAPQRCEEILRTIDGMYKAGDRSVKPNTSCFTAAINSWSKSREKSKARSAYRILQYMTKSYYEGNEDVKPNVVAYTAAMNACAFPPENDDKERRECFDIAVLLMEELRVSEFGTPNYLTYATFFEVCARTLPKGAERNAVAERTFVLCQRDGQVGEVVLDKLRRHFPDLLCEFLEGCDVNDGATVERIPAEWSRCVKGEKRRRRRPRGLADPKLVVGSVSKLHVVMNKRGMRGFYSKEKTNLTINSREEEDDGWMGQCRPLEETLLFEHI